MSVRRHSLVRHVKEKQIIWRVSGVVTLDGTRAKSCAGEKQADVTRPRIGFNSMLELSSTLIPSTQNRHEAGRSRRHALIVSMNAGPLHRERRESPMHGPRKA